MISPKFTIITASFNSKRTIAETIDSILNQSYTNFEYLIVDGSSNDHTINIVKSFENDFRQKAIRYKWISEPDLGIYDAWNKALKFVDGEWVIFIGSDDILLKNSLSSYADFINNGDLEYKFISSKAELISKNGSYIRTIGNPFNIDKIKRHMSIVHSGAIHHATLFHDFGNFSLNFGIVADYEFVLRISEKVKFGFLDKTTIKFRIGGVTFNSLKPIKQTLFLKNRYFPNRKTSNRIDFLIALMKMQIRHTIRKF